MYNQNTAVIIRQTKLSFRSFFAVLGVGVILFVMLQYNFFYFLIFSIL